MKTKKLTIIGTIVILIILLSGVIPVNASVEPPNPSPMDVGPIIREWEATPDRIEPFSPEEASEADLGAMADSGHSECTTDVKFWLRLNNVTGGYGAVTFDKIAESGSTEIWVQTNLAWPTGDPRPVPVITCAQAAYMLGQFDTIIYPKETSFFGMPDFHDGTNAYLPGLLGLPADYYFSAEGKQVVLISNIRDENYYDPTYPTYIAGFYTSAYETYFDRNVMSIDAYDWVNRTGSSGTRPYLYEGVFAHEYQHLLHDDYDSDEENFVNEGLADYAQVLVGYGQSVTGHLEDTADLPENSLVVWGDQGDLEILADYGQAFLFQYYMKEKFGLEFIRQEFLNPLNGISGIDDTLAMFNIQKTFADVYHDYSVAGLLDDIKWKSGLYGFKGLNFKFNIGTPAAPNPQAYDTPGAPPWGTDYVWLNVANAKKITKLVFNGLEYSTFPTKWTSDGSVLWSGTGDLIDNWAIFPTAGGGTLKFDTQYDIEEYWDFGFVQVSTDGGYTWTSLANDSTIGDYDPSAHPKIIANLPGLTGTQTEWKTMSFDLSAYAGQDILIAFRMITDWATSYDNWYIDNVYVDDVLISDGSDISVFKDITEILPINNDFTVTFVGMNPKKGGGYTYQVLKLKLGQNTEEENGIKSLKALLSSSKKAVMLVTFDAPEGFTDYAAYDYEIIYKTNGPK